MTPIAPTRIPSRAALAGAGEGAAPTDVRNPEREVQRPEVNLPGLPFGVPPITRGSAGALRPPICTTPGVNLRVHQDDGSRPATVASLPGSAFYCTRNAPSLLEGPRVRIAVDGDIKTAESNIPGLAQLPLIGLLTTNVITEPSQVAPVTANAEGHFDAPEVDTAQTTAFYAANQTITLAERAARRPIPWGDGGQLTVRPNAFVGSSSVELNAFFVGGTREVQLGSLGNVRDGRLVPLDGSSVAFLEHALAERESAVSETESRLSAESRPELNPAGLREVRAQAAALRAIVDAARRDDVAEVERLLTAERARETITDPRQTNGGLAGRLFGGFARPPSGEEPLPIDRFLTLSARARYGGDLMRAGFEIARIRPLTGQLVRLAQDRFVGSHEAGHAALATLMPAMFSSAPGRAMHEAYGDSVALLTAFDSPEVIRAALAETEGDLTRSNSVSRIAEQLARTIASSTRDPADDGNQALRDAASVLRVSDIAGLDPAASGNPPVPDGSRAGEHHYVSRIISGALYEHFAREASDAARGATDPVASVQRVRDVSASTLHAAMLFMPENGGSLHDIGAALLRGARETESPESVARFESILRERGLLAADTTPRITRDLPVATIGDVDSARRGQGPLAARVGGWTSAEGVVELERITDGYGFTRVRFGKPNEILAAVAGSLVFDRNGRLVAASDGDMSLEGRAHVCSRCGQGH